IGAYMQGMQSPTTKSAFLNNCVEHDFATGRIEQVGFLCQLPLVGRATPWIWFDEGCTDLVVLIVDGARGLAVQPGTVRGEGDEIGKRMIGHGKSSSEIAATGSLPSLSASEGQRFTRLMIALRWRSGSDHYIFSLSAATITSSECRPPHSWP